MTKQEYINKVNEFRKEFIDKMKELDEFYIKELTSDVEIGDLVSSCSVYRNIIVDNIKPYKEHYHNDGGDTIRPDELGYYFRMGIELPIPMFYGLETKGDNGVPSKKSTKGYLVERYGYEIRKRHDDGLFHHEEYKSHYIPKDLQE